MLGRLKAVVRPPLPARRTPRVESSSIVRDPQALLKGQGLDSYQPLVLGRDAEVFMTSGVLDRLCTWISRDGGSLDLFPGTPVARYPPIWPC